MLKFSKSKLGACLFHPKGTYDFEAFRALSLVYPDIAFRTTSRLELFKRYEIESKYALVLFRDFDEGKKLLVFESSPTYKSM